MTTRRIDPGVPLWPPGHIPGRQVSQNDALLDSALQNFGLTRRDALSLGLPDVVQPVVVLDPQAPPTFRKCGSHPLGISAGGAGFRSEAVIGCGSLGPNGGGGGGILAVWFTVKNDGANIEIVYGPTVSGYTAVSAVNGDLRFGVGTQSATPVSLLTRNNAAANATGTIAGSLNVGPANYWFPHRFGPYYLPSGSTPTSALMVRPVSDNINLNLVWWWEFFPSRKS